MQVHFCPEGATVIIHDTPKTVGDHAESRRKGRLAQRHLHLTAFGQRSEMPIGLGNTIIIFCAHIFSSVFVVVFRHTTNEAAYSGHGFFRRSLGGASKNSRCAHLEMLFLDSDSFRGDPPHWLELLCLIKLWRRPIRCSRRATARARRFSAPPGGVSVEEIQLTNAVRNAVSTVSAVNGAKRR